jgi:cytochrome c-type biogenesis protein CcmF
VGEPFFNAAFTPFMVALALILPVGAMLAWKRGDPGRGPAPLLPVLVLALALGRWPLRCRPGGRRLGPVGLALGAWVVFGALPICGRAPAAGATGAAGAPDPPAARDWGKATAHSGLGSRSLPWPR